MTKLLQRLFARSAPEHKLTPHQRSAQTRRARQSARTWQHIEEMRASMSGGAR